MIKPLRTPTEFRELRSTGQRATSGPLTLIAAPAADLTESHVAYAIGKRFGTAVERNRIRRRLRAVMADADRDGRLTRSRYLVICEPTTATFDHSQLVTCVEQALQQLGDAA